MHWSLRQNADRQCPDRGPSAVVTLTFLLVSCSSPPMINSSKIRYTCGGHRKVLNTLAAHWSDVLPLRRLLHHHRAWRAQPLCICCMPVCMPGLSCCRRHVTAIAASVQTVRHILHHSLQPPAYHAPAMALPKPTKMGSALLTAGMTHE